MMEARMSVTSANKTPVGGIVTTEWLKPVLPPGHLRCWLTCVPLATTDLGAPLKLACRVLPDRSVAKPLLSVSMASQAASAVSVEIAFHQAMIYHQGPVMSKA